MNNPCDNGLACDGLETCAADGGQAVCTDGTPVECEFPTFCTEPDAACVDPCDGADCTDDNDCTTDTCTTNEDGTTTCNSDTACDDADACTEGDACGDDGVCAGTEIPCATGEVCADGVCVCADDSACDDGDVCTGTETCDVETGECVAGTPVDCDDGEFCNGNETCEANAETGEPDCVPGTDPCAEDETCNEDTDECEIVRPCTTDADCEDTDLCTDDFCGDDGFCVVNAIECDDDDECTVDSCDAGVCDFEPTVCDEGFTCNSTSGQCEALPEPAVCCFGTSCQENTQGVMYCIDAGGAPRIGVTCADEPCALCENDADCDDGIGCTDDTCDSGTGACVNTDNCAGSLSCLGGADPTICD